MCQDGDIFKGLLNSFRHKCMILAWAAGTWVWSVPICDFNIKYFQLMGGMWILHNFWGS